MKQIQCVEAYKALKKLSGIPMDLGISYRLMKLKKQLEVHYSFEEQEETKMFNEFHGSFNEDGKTMTFPTPEEAKEFSRKWQELRNMEIDEEFTPVDVPLDQNFQLTMQDMEALDGFVNFIE